MKKLSLTTWILLGMLFGVLLGHFLPEAGKAMAPISAVFLRLIKSIIAPLLFGTLVYGIAGHGSMKDMGRIGLRSFIYFEVVTTIALFIGLAFANGFQPGVGQKILAGNAPTGATISLASVLEHTFPASIIDAMAKGEVLQVVVFTFLFGAACASIGDKARPVVNFCEALGEVMFTYTRYVMYLAPLGVMAAMATMIGSKGISTLFSLLQLVAVTWAAQLTFVVFILGGIMWWFRIPLRPFLQAVREPALIAFTTTSSEAALPRALENMQRMGVPRHIVSFVIPTGYSMNLDGSTLYLSVASLFIAQAAGIQMSWQQQLLMMLTFMLTSKGVAGVPRAAIVVVSGVLPAFGLPMEGVPLLMSVDALLDMARTTVNVLGNCLAAAAIAKWEEKN
jgi:proton glutamate symport protein